MGRGPGRASGPGQRPRRGRTSPDRRRRAEQVAGEDLMGRLLRDLREERSRLPASGADEGRSQPLQQVCQSLKAHTPRSRGSAEAATIRWIRRLTGEDCSTIVLIVTTAAEAPLDSVTVLESRQFPRPARQPGPWEPCGAASWLDVPDVARRGGVACSLPASCRARRATCPGFARVGSGGSVEGRILPISHANGLEHWQRMAGVPAPQYRVRAGP
jgi:hypothetical protein